VVQTLSALDIAVAIAVVAAIVASRLRRETPSPQRFAIRQKWRRAFRLIVSSIESVLSWLARGPSGSNARLRLWIAINVLAIAVLVTLPPGLAILGFIGGIGGLHLGVVMAALAVVSEELDVWNGLIRPDDVAFKQASAIKDRRILFTASAFLLLLTATFAMRWDEISNIRLLDQNVQIDCDFSGCAKPGVFLVYLTATVAQFPLIEWLLSESQFGRIGYTVWAGKLYFAGVYLAIGVWAFGVIRIIHRQNQDIDDLVGALHAAPEGDAETVNFLHRRATRAPESASGPLLRMAIEHQDGLARKRAMTAIRVRMEMRHIVVPAFLQAFLKRLLDQSTRANDRADPPLNRIQGLNISRHLIEKERESLGPDAVVTSLKLVGKLSKQWRDHKGSAVSSRDLVFLESIVIRLFELAEERYFDTRNKGFPKDALIDIVVYSDSERNRSWAFGQATKTCHPQHLGERFVGSIQLSALTSSHRVTADKELGRMVNSLNQFEELWADAKTWPAPARAHVDALIKGKIDELSEVEGNLREGRGSEAKRASLARVDSMKKRVSDLLADRS
jgi:hypothetical protein